MVSEDTADDGFLDGYRVVLLLTRMVMILLFVLFPLSWGGWAKALAEARASAKVMVESGINVLLNSVIVVSPLLN